MNYDLRTFFSIMHYIHLIIFICALYYEQQPFTAPVHSMCCVMHVCGSKLYALCIISILSTECIANVHREGVHVNVLYSVASMHV